MNVFVFRVTIYAVRKNQDPVTYLSVSQVAVSDKVSFRGKWKTEIYPFQRTATNINSF